MRTFKNDNILINSKTFKTLQLNSTDLQVLSYIIEFTAPCGTTQLGGQVCTEYVGQEIAKKHKKYNQTTINYSINKLREQRVLLKVPNKHLFYVNPNFIWIPRDCDNITQEDKEYYRTLKVYIKINNIQ